MNKKLKVILIIALIFCVAFMPVAALAHSGRTDAYGGHKDNKNKSGLGYYHYHCGGYPAHLHDNGICPYSSYNVNSSSTTSSTSSNTTSSTPKATVTDFAIKLNGNTVNNAQLKYPILTYKDITYLPMTYSNALTLGLTTEWKDYYLDITKAPNAVFTADTSGTAMLGAKVSISSVDYDIYIDGSEYTQESDYPFLNYAGITYLPLTTATGEKLNLSIIWNAESGIAVTPK